tara:strand:- start:1786 stop:2721 length:936 start_codon:yes stop_codon:yes gene_type:complete
MIRLSPINQTKLFGLHIYLEELIKLENYDKLPNKILFSGQKGTGKCTLAYHFINYVLSKNEEAQYDIKDYQIDPNNHSFKTILNKSNPNFTLIDIENEKKFIDINQIRELIYKLNKSSFNDKPRFVLIDNVEYLNLSSINSLLKILEEPSPNVFFILINNSNEKILPTLYSRCINFKISLSKDESLSIANHLLSGKINELINEDLINYYSTPGNIYNLAEFAKLNKYDLSVFNLKEFLKLFIKDKHYKKDSLYKYLIFDYIEFYFRKIDLDMNSKILEKYDYFLKRINDTKKFNLDYESLFIEFDEEILNG